MKSKYSRGGGEVLPKGGGGGGGGGGRSPPLATWLHTRYPIVARTLGRVLRPSASREQRYLAYKLRGCART